MVAGGNLQRAVRNVGGAVLDVAHHRREACAHGAHGTHDFAQLIAGADFDHGGQVTGGQSRGKRGRFFQRSDQRACKQHA